MDLQERIENAERHAELSRQCAQRASDKAQGCDRPELEDDGELSRRMVKAHGLDVEVHLGTAQALRNEQRSRGYGVRKAARR